MEHPQWRYMLHMERCDAKCESPLGTLQRVQLFWCGLNIETWHLTTSYDTIWWLSKTFQNYQLFFVCELHRTIITSPNFHSGCIARLTSVGHFTCLAGRFFGSSGCLEPSEALCVSFLSCCAARVCNRDWTLICSYILDMHVYYTKYI